MTFRQPEILDDRSVLKLVDNLAFANGPEEGKITEYEEGVERFRTTIGVYLCNVYENNSFKRVLVKKYILYNKSSKR